MYLHRADVKSLVLKHQSEFRGSELVCEVVNSFWFRNTQWTGHYKLN
ncbi:MAG: hypothetical protein C5S38_07405 [Candidatus Methanophagaceae archaeon]|nr:MAG: hypothetical protein C5S38_07405 [Methanophagales archaeon]